MSIDNKAIVEAFFDAINHKDFDAFNTLVAEDYNDHMVGASRGRETLKVYFSGYIPVFPDLKIEILHIVAKGDIVAVHNRITATHAGEIAGIAATGRIIKADAMQFYRLADGRLAEHREVADLAGMRSQMSALEPV